MAIDGDIAVVGAPDRGSGHVYIFGRDYPNSDDWGEVAVLSETGLASHAKFGDSVAVNDNLGLILVGAPFDEDNLGNEVGTAWVYRLNGSNWELEAKFTSCDPIDGGGFGSSVSITDDALNGELALVGADQNGATGEGEAHLFRHLGAGWAQVDQFIASDAGASDLLGDAVSISGGQAIVGAPGWDATGNNGEGAAYIFDDFSTEACDCDADVNGDGVIDVLDLLAVLAAWGPCVGCAADINEDDTVNVLDLLAVLSAWGPCTDPGSGDAPEDVQDCIDTYGNDIEKMIGCIEALLRAEGQ